MSDSILNQAHLLEENEHFCVWNKPAGLSFHSEEGPGLVAQAEQLLQRKLFSVHRLDKVTSGLILLAKSSEVAALLSQLFSERQIDKYYLAVAEGKPKKKQGWIKGDMAKARNGCFKLLTSQNNPAITRFYCQALTPGVRTYLLKPFTGKTHQLRVALKSLSVPIMGDVQYSAAAADRVYLHAYFLSFNLYDRPYRFMSVPDRGQHFLSDDFKSILQLWHNPQQLNW